MSEKQAWEIQVEKRTPSQLRSLRLFILLLLFVWGRRGEKRKNINEAVLETADGDPSFWTAWLLYLFPTRGARLTLNVLRALSFLVFSTSAAWLGVDTPWGTNSAWGYPHARTVLERRREEVEQEMKDLLERQNAADQEVE
jgi:hypothetical protein